MMKIGTKAMIPNALTSANLWLGVFAIMNTMSGNYKLAAIYIIIAVFLDGLDGKAARKLKVSSEFGKQLDSLCDLVSFGVAPGILAFAVALVNLGMPGIIISAVYITAGAFRLARFNVLNITTHFIGIPITMAGGLMAIMLLFEARLSVMVIAAITLILSFLMVSNIKTPKF